MLYAQFYQKAVGSGVPIEACGDRAVIILDARTPLRGYLLLVEAVAKERGYIGFTLHRGESFTRSICVHAYTSVEA